MVFVIKCNVFAVIFMLIFSISAQARREDRGNYRGERPQPLPHSSTLAPKCIELFFPYEEIPSGYELADEWKLRLRRGYQEEQEWPPNPKYLVRQDPSQPYPDIKLHPWFVKTFIKTSVSIRPMINPVKESAARGLLRIESRLDEYTVEMKKNSVFKSPHQTPFTSRNDFSYLTLETLDYSFSEKKAIQDSNEKWLENDRDDFKDVIKSFMNVVISSYKNRRDWSPKMLTNLRAAAKKYADRTRFIFIKGYKTSAHQSEDTPWNNRRQIGTIGTIRNIIAYDRSMVDHDQDLPMEESLQTKLPFNGGIKLEIGSFTANKAYNKFVFATLMSSIIRDAQWLIQRPEHESGKNIFYTYADPASYRMYTSKLIGFKPMTGYEPIEYAGTTWRLIGSTAESLIGILDRLSTDRSSWTEDDQLVFTTLSKMMKDSNSAYWGKEMGQQESEGHNSQDGNRFSFTQKNGYLKFETNENRRISQNFDYSLQSIYPFTKSGTLSIYTSKIDPYNESSFGRTIEHQNYTYENGYLYVKFIDHQGYNHDLKIEIDPYGVVLSSFHSKVVDQTGKTIRDYHVELSKRIRSSP